MNTSPFIHSQRTSQVLVLQTLFSLLPITIGAIYFGGVNATIILFAALFFASLTDWFCTNRKVFDENCLITGLIFALILPPNAPWWISGIGASLAIALGKYSSGGLGKNIFNPTAFSRVFLMGLAPIYFFAAKWPIDGLSQATPLSKEIDSLAPSIKSLLTGGSPGTLAETMPAAVLLGGLILLFFRTIDWRVPLCYLATIAFCALILPPGNRILGHASWLAGNPLLHIFCGGSLFTAFFLLTDPVTSPLTQKGRLLFAAIAGCYTMLVRYYTLYPDGAILSVLLANATVPLIDQYSFPISKKKDSI